MEKKKQIPGKKQNNMDPLQDMQVYAAGHEADETLEEEGDITTHTNGGVPSDDSDDDDDEENDNDDNDDDERA